MDIRPSLTFSFILRSFMKIGIDFCHSFHQLTICNFFFSFSFCHGKHIAVENYDENIFLEEMNIAASVHYPGQ